MTLTVQSNVFPVVDPPGEAVGVTPHDSPGDCDRVSISDARAGKSTGPRYSRAVRLSLRSLTARKRRRLAGRLARYRALVSRIVDRLWDAHPTAETIPQRVDYREHVDLGRALHLNAVVTASACTVARQLVQGTRASEAGLAAAGTPVKAGKPSVDGMSLAFDHNGFAQHEDAKTCRGADYVIRIPSWDLVLPLKRTRRLNYWLSQPGARLGASVTFLDGEPDLTVTVIVPVARGWREEGDVLGLDMNMGRGGLATSEGDLLQGEEMAKTLGLLAKRGPRPRRDRSPENWKKRKARIASRRRTWHRLHRTSKRRASLRRRWKCQADRAVKLLPWERIRAIGIEDLAGLKTGKRGKRRGKNFRRRRAAWRYTHIARRLAERSQQDRVRLLTVEPAGTSVECSACGHVARENRRGHTLVCCACGYTTHADVNAARNIKARAEAIVGNRTRSVSIPVEGTNPADTHRAIVSPVDGGDENRAGASGEVVLASPDALASHNPRDTSAIGEPASADDAKTMRPRGRRSRRVAQVTDTVAVTVRAVAAVAGADGR